MTAGKLGGIAYGAAHWPAEEDRPTLVFLHGSGGSRVLWQGQVGALEAVANTVALDLPGHGESGARGCDSVAEYAARVMEWIRSAGLPRPVPCGLSLGGAIALQLLLDHGRDLHAGILVGTGARLRVKPTIFDSIRKDYHDFVAALPELAASPAADLARLQPLLAATLQTSAMVTAGDFRACDSFDVMSRLGEIDLPVLVVTAEEDQLTPPKYGDYLEANIRGARRVHLQHAGHLAPLERPAAFNDAVRGFLSTLE
jgi:pimeloyl-ACP methyl ester carboxylesterase